MSAGMGPFDKHTAALGVIADQATTLESLSNKAIDLTAATNGAFKPAEANWDGVCAAELRSAPEPVRRSAVDTSGALAWAAVPLRYWHAKVEAFNTEVDRIGGNLSAQAGVGYGAAGTDGQPPTDAQVTTARAEVEAAARMAYWTAYNTHVEQGATTTAGMFRDGPTEENLQAARDVGALAATPGAFTIFPAFWHDQNMRRAADDAAAFVRKLQDPYYEPTSAELRSLRDLLGEYADDEAFAYYFLDEIGPRGLLELNGQLATVQLSPPDAEEDGMLFDPDLAQIVGSIQLSLGTALATATMRRGTGGAYPGGYSNYNPGQYELSTDWVVDLAIAGRDQFDIGYPNSPLRYQGGVYGYQLLAPLLNNGDYDAHFLAVIGGDIVDFEIDQGGSEFWREAAAGEDLRLDWTNGYATTTPAGYDPVIALLDALDRNPEAARDLFTGLQTTSDADPPPPSGTRLPRLDYLLTDRVWFEDVPGGRDYTVLLMDDESRFRNPGLNTLGEVLEKATIGDAGHPPDDRSRLIVESIVYEFNLDEQMRGFANGEREGNTKPFEDNQVIPAEIEDSLANITAAYIWDVNRAVSDSGGALPGGLGAEFDQAHMMRFLAHLGKDEGAHETIREAEAAYAVAAYDFYLTGPGAEGDTLDDKLRSAQNVTKLYGTVAGALDYGAAAVHHQTTATADADHNRDVASRFAVANFVVDQVTGPVTAKIPVPGGPTLANGFIDGLLTEAQQQQTRDHGGVVDYTIGDMLSTGRLASADLAMTTLYQSGQLTDLPASLTPGGTPKPISEWDSGDEVAWQGYLDQIGYDSAGFLGEQGGSAYDDGYQRVNETVNRPFG